jgi:hypothetical protein
MITTEEAEMLAGMLEGKSPRPGVIVTGGNIVTALRSIAAERDALKAELDQAVGCIEDANAEREQLQAENARLRAALILARIAVSHACELSDRILYTQDLGRIDAALGETK